MIALTLLLTICDADGWVGQAITLSLTVGERPPETIRPNVPPKLILPATAALRKRPPLLQFPLLLSRQKKGQDGGHAGGNIGGKDGRIANITKIAENSSPLF